MPKWNGAIDNKEHYLSVQNPLNVCLLFVQIPDVTNKYKIEVLLFLHAVDQKII